tara:strand:+ start:148 stop:540 length:393 start_codon:yes stop_codon:yes gene_type:complete
MEVHDQGNKSHRESKTKVKKKKERKLGKDALKGKDPRAFAVASAKNAQKRQQRNLDREHRKLHLPMPSRSTVAPTDEDIVKLRNAKPGARVRSGGEVWSRLFFGSVSNKFLFTFFSLPNYCKCRLCNFLF